MQRLCITTLQLPATFITSTAWLGSDFLNLTNFVTAFQPTTSQLRLDKVPSVLSLKESCYDSS